MSAMKEEIYKRFERYVKINTQSDEKSETAPTTKGQLELAEIVLKELNEIGMKNAKLDKFGYVTAEIPSNTTKKVPAIAFLAHFDTSPDASGENVKPKLHKNYDGKDIVISEKDKMYLSPKDSPKLLSCIGHDIVTASGDTLLGADNKAGIAVIVTAMNYLIKHPEIKHGTLKVAFTPDEEVGKGVNNFDLKAFNAEYAYTVDGDVIGTIEDENFNADGVTIEVTGRAYHPGHAKNVMANAARIIADIVSSWPENMLPETTEHREGFILFNDIKGGIETAKASGIVRNHDLKKLKQQEELMSAIVAEKRLKYPAAKIDIKFKDQYRNMKEVLDKHPQVMKNVFSVFEKLGITPIHQPVRGGTDGARLSFMGLPTPNIFTGGDNFHGRHEWVSVDGMEKSAQVVASLAEEWEKNG